MKTVDSRELSTQDAAKTNDEREGGEGHAAAQTDDLGDFTGTNKIAMAICHQHPPSPGQSTLYTR